MLDMFLLAQEFESEGEEARFEFEKFKTLILGVNTTLYETLWGKGSKEREQKTLYETTEKDVEWIVPKSEDDLKRMVADWHS